MSALSSFIGNGETEKPFFSLSSCCSIITHFPWRLWSKRLFTKYKTPSHSVTFNVIIQEGRRSSTIFHSMEWARKPLYLQQRGHSTWVHQYPVEQHSRQEVLQAEVGTAQPNQACCSCCWTIFKLDLHYVTKNFSWGEKRVQSVLVHLLLTSWPFIKISQK